MVQNLKSEEGIALLSSNYIGRLAYMGSEGPYIVPITYFFHEPTHSILSYSAEGHKLKSMRNNPGVCMEVDEISTIKDWRSVVVHGTFKEIQGSEAKQLLHAFSEGVKAVISAVGDEEARFISDFSSKSGSDISPVVYRISISKLTAKYRGPD